MERIVSLSHLFVTVFISNFAMMVVVPGLTDITMEALCPGRDECSLAIYLTGIQQAVVGVGTVVVTPLIGTLSDVYGRKTLLTLPMTVSIIPLAILAYRRTTSFFYAYYVATTLASMAGQASILCLSLAYAADNISEGMRASAFGIVSGVIYASFVGGTMAALFISAAQTFQVAVIASMVAVVYMRIFLKESKPRIDSLAQPILKTVEETDQSDGESESSTKVEVFKKVPSLKDILQLLRSSPTFSLAAFVAFFNSLTEGGLQSSLMYVFKARFHFSKDQFAVLMLIIGIAGAISQLLFMPLLVPVFGEQKLLSTALFISFLSLVVDSIAWATWVPFVVGVFSIFSSFSNPSLRSIISREVGPNEQGIAQGCISGISSFASIISPLIFSPLTDLFLSERAPFYFPGFSLLCMALASFIAFIPSVMIRATPSLSSNKVSSNACTEASYARV